MSWNSGGLLEPNPFNKLHIRIHSPQQLPRIIPKQTIHDLLQNAYEAYAPGCRETLRDIVVLELLFSTGLRVSELCALSKATFSLTDEGLRLLINGKGGKERIIQIITPELLRLLHVYCSEYSKEIEEQGAILFNRRGRPLSPRSVRRIINKYMNPIGKTSHVTPHMFRHPNVKPTTKTFSKFMKLIEAAPYALTWGVFLFSGDLLKHGTDAHVNLAIHDRVNVNAALTKPLPVVEHLIHVPFQTGEVH